VIRKSAIIAALVLTPCLAHGEPLPNARLSISSDPLASSDTPSSTIHYTDGLAVDQTLDISAFAIGDYDVFQSAGALSTSGAAADYIGGFHISVAGQVTTSASIDYDRKWEIWNAFNKRRLALQVTTQERSTQYCPTAQYSSSNYNVGPINNNALNRGAVYTGRKENIRLVYQQRGFMTTANSHMALKLFAGIGWNSQTVISGVWGGGTIDDTAQAEGKTLIGRYIALNAVGYNTVTMLVAAVCRNAGVVYAQFFNSSAAPQLGDQALLWIEWDG